MANNDTERLAELRAELAEIEGRIRQTATKLLSDKVKHIKALVEECEKIAIENKLTFTIPFGGYYGEGCTFDGEVAATGKAFSGWDSSYC